MEKKSDRNERMRLLRVDPVAFMAMQADETNSRLADLFEVNSHLLQHLKETTSEGVDFPIDDQTVTSSSTVTLNFKRNYPNRLIRAVDIFNKGSATAYIRVNQDAQEFPIEDREYLPVRRPKATIETITIRVASGSAVLRMIGHY